ncbi:transglutaminase domain protein [Leptothrix cholodnii SP-6]|uniref:Transglutaminase domain protein n=1 Tax=Leptothrix cholodnii (strain ATCC 51168 / LMG 8142 / SP-6) TaxID=395495 RepID=B1Y7B3_LEPCP|nr:transglutaminase domain-containing protein [Leptothrix cholodnii]ACB34868.1 transglutaminase domain protein [Leptothrix cholodnii SP-6]
MSAEPREGALPSTPEAVHPIQRPVRVLRVQHETRYDYDGPVELAHHMAHLRPRMTPWQRIRDWSLRINPWPDAVVWDAPTPLDLPLTEPLPGAETAAQADSDVAVSVRSHPDGALRSYPGADMAPGVQQSQDPWGNWRAVFSHSRVHRRLTVRACFTAELLAPPPMRLKASPPWEQVARRLRYQPGQPFDEALEFVLPSTYAPRDAALARLGAEVFLPGTPLLAGAVALMHLVYRRFEYHTTATSVATRAPEALAQRRGVCQDFAHVMIGALRSLGLAARYVSGYLLTQPPPGQPRLVGADASHAWVQVWCPVHGWVALDPTNAVPAGLDHVTLAWGRDYADVAPLRGVIRGGGGPEPRVSVTVEPLTEPEEAGRSIEARSDAVEPAEATAADTADAEADAEPADAADAADATGSAA